MTSFIKKKTGEISHKVFRSIRDHGLRVSPFSSSKLFVKVSRQRNLSFSFEKHLAILKFFQLSPILSKSRRSFVNFQLDNSLKNVSSSKLISTSVSGRRCVSVSNDFRLSRIVLRKLAALGYLPGVIKSSW